MSFSIMNVENNGADETKNAADEVINSRAYQLEMLDESLKGNVIVAMDTGSGKTHVAVLRIKHELEVAKTGKIIWFLVPTVGLCLQQLAVLQSQIASVQIKSFTSLDNIDKWSNQPTWDAVLTNVNIVVATYQVLCDVLCHGFVKLNSLALIVFDEAHNCIKNNPGSKLMAMYYWPAKEKGNSVPHILGLTASPVKGSKLDDLETLESTLDARCTSPRIQKTDLALHVKLPTLMQILFNKNDTLKEPKSRTPTMKRLRETFISLNIHEDPEIIRLRSGNTDADKRKLKKMVLNRKTFIQTLLTSFMRASDNVQRSLGDWAVDTYISQVTYEFIQCTEIKNPKFLEWEHAEKQYLANIFRRLHLAPAAINILTQDRIADKARILIDFLTSCNKNTIGIIFVKERTMAYMLYLLLSEHSDTSRLFRLGIVVGTSFHTGAKKDIFEFSHHEAQTKTLAKFRTGEINLLIATSAVEEGIDVPKCNLVVCFDEPDNIKSFIQRRGRARSRDSRLLLLLDKDAKRCIADWEDLEIQMKLQYEQEERRVQKQGELEKDEEDLRYEVECTGAILDMDAAKGHLECFCSRICPRGGIQMRPEYIILDESQQEPNRIKAKVLLPGILDPSLRVHQSKSFWRSEKNATKDAAFQAYVALYEAGLIDDNLMPLKFPEPLKYTEKKYSLIEVQEQFNPWPIVAQAWEDKEQLQRRVLSVKDETGSTMCRIQMLIPAMFPDIEAIRLYWSLSSEWMIEVGPATTIQYTLLTSDDTTALLSLSFGHRWELEPLRHIALFKAVDVDVPSFLKQEMSCISMDCAKDPVGLLRDPQNRGHPYLFHKFLSAKPHTELMARPHKDYKSFSQDQPFIAVQKWSKRSDFLHPIVSESAEHDASSADYFTAYPQSLLKMDTLPIAFSQFGLLIPSILHKVEVQLLVAELCATVLLEIEIEAPNFELIRTAISAPVAREENDYEKLELLGDSVLKFLSSVFVLSKYVLWPEKYLSQEMAQIVSNSRLSGAGIARSLDKFILTKPFTGSKWRPIYVDTQLGDKSKTSRTMSTKMIADVVEALIGAGLKMDNFPNFPKSLSIAKLFLPEIDLPSLESGRLRLFEIAASDVPLPANMNHLETLLGYSFKRKSLLVQSMSHSSHSTATTASYDRLEFLGDAILDIIIVTELIKYEELPQSDLHHYKTSLVNGDFLSFICLELKTKQTTFVLKQNPKPDQINTEEAHFPLPLWGFMRHDSQEICAIQPAVERRHTALRDDIIEALNHGEAYPWSLLAKVNANKFYSDLVESLLGAIWVDSGDLEVCKQVLGRMGVLNFMHRLVKDRVHVLHPREELSILAADKKVLYEVQTPENPNAGGEWTCKVCVGEDEILEVNGGVSKEEVKTRAAEGAVPLLRRRNRRSGTPSISFDV